MMLDAQLFYLPEIGKIGAMVGSNNMAPHLQQKFCEIGNVLTGDAGDDCSILSVLIPLIGKASLIQNTRLIRCLRQA